LKKLLIIFIIALLTGVLLGYSNHQTIIAFIDGEGNIELNEAKEDIINNSEMLVQIKKNIKPLETTEIAIEEESDTGTKEEVKEIKTIEQLEEEIAEDINKIGEDLKNNKLTKYIKDIEFMDEYSKTKIKVNKKEYDNSTNTGTAPLILAITISSYQEVKGLELDISIEIIDIDTGDIIKTYNY